MKKTRVYLFCVLVFLLFLPFTHATPYIRMVDDWYSEEGSLTDEVIFVNYEIYTELRDVDSSADMICYDWQDDGSWDNCYWDEDGCGGSCDEDSCDYYSTPAGMSDSWKAGCDIDLDGYCYIGSDVPQRICDGCDGVDTSTKQETYIDARIYYDCDNSAGERSYEDISSNNFYVVDTKKYDCDSSPTYDFEGEYETGSWIDIESGISCSSTTTECDEDYDDDEVTTATGSIDDPCRTINGYSCSSDSACLSDVCCSNMCSESCDPNISISPSSLTYNVG